eukprot:7420-Prymnesium_polylepis.1
MPPWVRLAHVDCIKVPHEVRPQHPELAIIDVLLSELPAQRACPLLCFRAKGALPLTATVRIAQPDDPQRPVIQQRIAAAASADTAAAASADTAAAASADTAAASAKERVDRELLPYPHASELPSLQKRVGVAPNKPVG